MNNTRYFLRAVVFCLIAGVTFTTAFVAPSQKTTTASSQLQVVWDPRNAENDSGLVAFPTDSQRAEIKKEAKKRKAGRQMPYFSFSDEEMNGPWSDETMMAIWKQLTESEMMELKGICRESLRDVFQTAGWFCEELEELIAPAASDSEDEEDETFLPVALISTKGHTALIYCPTLPVDHPEKLVLRTSVGQKNVWKARPKPLRDIRGQIITDANPDQADWDR
mmetsp:Transcript_3907/g.9310  ORF Transcript_3907/g.9310 Transcript_3907/m.9310 type:complete len:222 (-) Transcript_3907:195-860(-)